MMRIIPPKTAKMVGEIMPTSGNSGAEVGVGDGDTVPVEVGVDVGVGERVPVGVGDKVPVGVGVNVGVGERVPVEVGVTAFARGEIWIEVGDSGPGMDDETKARAFEPWFTRRAEQGGRGLGLALCRLLIRQLGGEVEIAASRPGAPQEPERSRSRIQHPA